MAMTAALTTGAATVKAGAANGKITLTVSNSAGSAVKVLGIRLIAYDGGTTNQSQAVSLSQPQISAANNNVAAAGSTAYPCEVSFHEPDGGSNKTVDITAEVTCSDGTTIYPTALAFTVTAKLPWVSGVLG